MREHDVQSYLRKKYNLKHKSEKINGGIWEEKEITIGKNYILHHLADPCEHTKLLEEVEVTYFNNISYKEKIYIIPYVIIAENEGGYNSTGICLDCVLEYAEKIGKIKING